MSYLLPLRPHPFLQVRGVRPNPRNPSTFDVVLFRNPDGCLRHTKRPVVVHSSLPSVLSASELACRLCGLPEFGLGLTTDQLSRVVPYSKEDEVRNLDGYPVKGGGIRPTSRFVRCWTVGFTSFVELSTDGAPDNRVVVLGYHATPELAARHLRSFVACNRLYQLPQFHPAFDLPLRGTLCPRDWVYSRPNRNGQSGVVVAAGAAGLKAWVWKRSTTVDGWQERFDIPGEFESIEAAREAQTSFVNASNPVFWSKQK